VASRAGVIAHGTTDAPTDMLAEAVARLEGDGKASLHLASGNGVVAAVAAARGFEVTALDRYAPHAEATARTLEANEVPEARTRARHAVLPANEPDPIRDRSQYLVTLRIPTDRVGVQQAIEEAFRVLRSGGTLLMAGANDEGGRTAAKSLEAYFGNATLEAQHSGCRLLRATRTSAQPMGNFGHAWTDPLRAHELVVPIAGVPTAVYTRPGVFSWEHLDDATAILLDVMQVPAGASVLDLGCGAGILTMAAARWSGTGRVLGVDADADAVRCARLTAREAGLANVEIRASDVDDAVGNETFDVIVTNPPFHLGKATELTIPRAFIDAADAHLAPGGSLYLVANRQLPYERLVAERFGAVQTLHDGRRFKVLGARR
jgi:16S rRNA (guanine1207-N2)-methyltransferase